MGDVHVFPSLIKVSCFLFFQVYNLNKDNQTEGSKCPYFGFSYCLFKATVMTTIAILN